MDARRMKILISLMFFLAFVAGGLWYFTQVKPLASQITDLKASVAEEKKLIEKYEIGKEGPSDIEIETLALQKRVPVVENVEQFLLMLEEAEVVSDSLILNVTFSKSTEETNEEDRTVEEDIEAIERTNGNLPAETKEGEAESVTTAPPQPAGLQKLIANLSIEADNYFEIEKFVQKLEQFDRIINVESLDFTGFTEVSNITEISDELPTLTFNMTVATYFYPKLEELKEQAPKYEPTEPAEKKNPFYQSEIPKNINRQITTTKIPPKEEIRDGVTYKVYTYNVAKGDNIFDIALSYYGNQDLEKGQKLILEWNNMDSINDLEAGTSIKIPVPIKYEENNINETPEETVKNGVSYKVHTYNVAKGDNIQKIALNYYGSKNLEAGQKLIMEWNNMESEKDLQAGTTIEIPIPVEEIMK